MASTITFINQDSTLPRESREANGSHCLNMPLNKQKACFCMTYGLKILLSVEQGGYSLLKLC